MESLNIALHDPFKEVRERLLGKQKFAYFFGCFKDKKLIARPTSKDQPDGTDLLKLNTLAVKFTPLHIPLNYLRQNVKHPLGNFDCILNLVTNPEVNAKILQAMEREAKGYKGRLINHPRLVLDTTRDANYRKLSDIPDVIVPPTIRLTNARPNQLDDAIARAGLRFPAIVRRAGTHLGSSMRAIRSAEELRPHLKHGTDFYLTSLASTRSADKLYRKFRFFFIGGEIILLHVYVSDHWNVHGKDRERFMSTRPELIEAERRHILSGLGGLRPNTRRALAEIGERVGLDYFGIDCGLTGDGKILLFEANAAMNVFNAAMEDPRYEYLQTPLSAAQAGFRRLLLPDYQPRTPKS
jgi:hypothetical protein